MPPVRDDIDALRALAATRWRMAVGLTLTMTVSYLVFIAMVAWAKPVMGRALVPGLSIGILFGVFIILDAWLLILVYVVWANRKYDPELHRLKSRAEDHR
jgi:uncharacterized membrane protein (DUF485 family)